MVSKRPRGSDPRGRGCFAYAWMKVQLKGAGATSKKNPMVSPLVFFRADPQSINRNPISFTSAFIVNSPYP